MTTAALRQERIAQIRALPEQVAELVADLSEEELTAQPLRGEWSVAQNVHHLCDSHLNSYVRCKLILTEDRPPLKPYDQELWAALPDASAADLADSLALLRSLHGRWTRFWESLADEDWDRTGLHPENGEMSLDLILERYAAHGAEHLDQISRTRAAL